MNEVHVPNRKERIVRRKIKPQNLVCHKINCEHRISHRAGTKQHAIRDFYKCVYPNLTVINVGKRAGFLRKLSPDGSHSDIN